MMHKGANANTVTIIVSMDIFPLYRKFSEFTLSFARMEPSGRIWDVDFDDDYE